MATRLYERLLQEGKFVPYRLERRTGAYYSVCPCFIDAEHEFVTARDLFWADPSSHATPSFATLTQAAENQGASDLIAQLSQIFTLDYILGNVDRHLSNFGIIRRQSDMSFERCAPIFDTGLSLLCHGQDGDVDAIKVPANPLLGRQSQQLALVQDLTWFDEGRLQGFGEEVMEILRQCPSRYMDRERIAFIGAFVSSGIQVAAELKATEPVDPDDIAAIDQRAQLIDAMRARLMREADTGTRLHV